MSTEGENDQARRYSAGVRPVVRLICDGSWADARVHERVLSIDAEVYCGFPTVNPKRLVIPATVSLVPVWEGSGAGVTPLAENLVRLMASLAGADRPFQGFRTRVDGKGLIYVPMMFPTVEP